MRKVYLVAVLGVLLMPLLATAQSAFNGTWKVDMNKVGFPTKPDIYLLQNGMYECKSCVPAIDVKANGQDQKVMGHPYYNSIAIKVVTDHEVEETDKKDGKTVATSKMMVSSDGNTMTYEFSDSSNTSGAPVTGKGEAMRVGAKAPAGANAISGSWRTTKMENISDNGITWTYKVSGDELSMNAQTGQSYMAKMDGADVPFKGDPGITTASVKSVGKNTIVETFKRDGKVIGLAKSTVSADGKTLNVVYEDKLHGSTMNYKATKQ
ncbi:MAG: hypothetical protein ABSD98_04275 [Candidatus Korobacteraceae bacterium]|jgi:hypothetical protein